MATAAFALVAEECDVTFSHNVQNAAEDLWTLVEVG